MSPTVAEVQRWKWVDRALFGYFLSHIPATVCMDAQAVLPTAWVPASLRQLQAWYIVNMNDPLMQTVARPGHHGVWFQSLVYCELLFQLPIFVMAVRVFWRLLNQPAEGYRAMQRWRLPLFAYAVHTATTLMPVLAEMLAWPSSVSGEDSTDAIVVSFEQKLMLFSIYLPYLIFPLLLIWRLLPHFQDGNSKLKHQ